MGKQCGITDDYSTSIDAIDELMKLFHRVYESGNFVECICEPVFIALPKMERTRACNKYRTFSLINQVTKNNAAG